MAGETRHGTSFMTTLRIKAVSFLALATSITYGGFYGLMAVFLAFTGSISGTRILTMPLRMIILIALCIGFFRLSRVKVSRANDLYEVMFLIFSAFYTLRIIVELFSASGRSELHRSPIEILYFFVSFVAIPFLTVSRLNLKAAELEKVMNYTLFGLLFFSVTSSIAHSEHIQTGLRYAIVFGAENVMSPLFLSYAGSLGIGLGAAAVLRERRINFMAISGLITSLTSLIPFFMGASRGSVIALVLPILFILVSMRGRSVIFASVLSGSLIFAMILASSYLGSDVFVRISNIQQSIESESGEASRILIWLSSFRQFQENPAFGNSLENLQFNFYPHNVFLEVLISTGILGFAPFFILILMAIKKCFFIARKDPRQYWIVVLFLQSLVQSTFSGALYSASWLALSLALLAVASRFVRTDGQNELEAPMRGTVARRAAL